MDKNKKCEYCDNNYWNIYTEEELNEAVKAENEACALECDKISTDFAGVKWSLADTAAEVIRARIK